MSAAPATPPAGSTDAPPPTRRRWLVLGTVALAQLMVVLDTTVVNIALPTAQADLGFSDNDRQWVVTAYALAFGALLLLGGRLGDIVGRRRMFLASLVGFAAASALGGFADSFGMLVAARALQGVFAAGLAPAALAILTTTFTHPRERARAFGVFGAIAGMGAAIGLLLGGLLTETIDWTWNLFINVPIAAIAVVGGVVLLDRRHERGDHRLEIPSVVLSSVGLFALVYGFSQAEPRGWGDLLTWGPIAGSLVLLTAFVQRQRTTAHPVLPLGIVLDRDRGAAFLAMLIASSGMFGVFLFVTYYLQSVLGYTPIQTGLAFMATSAAIIVTAQLQTNLLLPRIGPKVLVPVGMGIGVVAMLLFTTLDATSTYAHVWPGLALFGVAMGLIMPAVFQIATRGVAPSQAGAASAAVSTAQQVGGAVGTAVLNTLAATAATAFATDHATSPTVGIDAALHSFETAYVWGAGIFAVGIVVTALLFRTRSGREARAAASTQLDAEAATTVLAH